MKKKDRDQLCVKMAIQRIQTYKQLLADRHKETRKLFGHRIYIVDPHTHSNFSDGSGTVSDNYRHAKNIGIDFMFATDHRRIGQRKVTRRWHDASWGQEPGIGTHHIGLLCNNRIFRHNPKLSFAETLEKARKAAPFTWIPHPVGWFPRQWYSDEVVDQLREAGESFAMEVINGALKVLRAYDQFDAKAVATWDRLLCDGRKITAIGGSDAHCPYDIGTVWTGVFAKRLSVSSIINALNNGTCFASESALLDFSCNKRPMGTVIRARSGSSLALHFRVADSAGIARVRIVSQGRTIKDINARGARVMEGDIRQNTGRRKTYYRLESIASDDLRAFSTPIYVEPHR